MSAHLAFDSIKIKHSLNHGQDVGKSFVIL